MEQNTANPLIITLLFVARCLVPLIIMLGISYVLKRLGLIQEPPPPPEEPTPNGSNNQSSQGGLSHGKV